MKRVAVYPGSFDPPTLGHLDLIERGSKLFDELVVGIGRNSTKKPFLTAEQRVEVLQECLAGLPNVRVVAFEGLLIHFAGECGAQSIIRGLRATHDFEYEFQMAMVNRRLNDHIDTLFLMTSWEHSVLSSSIVREVALLGGDFREMVPEPVARLLDGVVRSRVSQ